MSRVIHTENLARNRTYLTKGIVRALNELMKQSKMDEQTRDLTAFIVIALDEISKSIDDSVSAWEKRGYWLKADRFRMDWEWTQRLAEMMRKALTNNDWEKLVTAAGEAAKKLIHVQLPKREPKTKPWIGCWEKLEAAKRP